MSGSAARSGWRAGSAGRILTIAGMTMREALRRKVLVVALLMMASYLTLYGLAVHFAAASMPQAGGGDGMAALVDKFAAAQMLYAGLFPAGVMIGLTAVFASVGAVSSELDTGVMYGVLARPVRRAEIVLGKALGLAVMLVTLSLVLNGSVVGLARWKLHSPLDNVAGGLALFALEPLILLAIALLGSTRLPTLANGVLCMAAYGVGAAGGLIEQIAAALNNQAMSSIGIASSLVMPVDAVHRKAATLLMPGGLLLGDLAGSLNEGGPFGVSVTSTPSTWMIVYALVYSAGMLWLATRVFAKRDL